MKKLVALSALLLLACNPNKTHLDTNFHPTDRGWGSPLTRLCSATATLGARSV